MHKLLFFNKDNGGVNYFRTETPAIQLKSDYSDIFDISIKNSLKNETNIDEIVDELSVYDIIHYHRSFVNNIELNLSIINKLKDKNIILIYDIDDYWVLDITHLLYTQAINSKLKELTISNIVNADYVTTTTDHFLNEIIKYNKNVLVLKNSVNPNISPQFVNNNKFNRDVVNITYLGGSSHLYDLKLIEGTINILNSDKELKNKFKIILGGFDTSGIINEKIMNPEFIKSIKILNLYTNDFINQFKKHKGDIEKIKGLPKEVIDAFKNKVFIYKKRNITPKESIYYKYENILTDNYRLLNNDTTYLNYLNKFTKEKYINENKVNYVRRWTAKTNEYAKILDETDILLAPLVDNKFNNYKSNLKQVEAVTRKLPIVCSDVLPYNVDGINGVNCILIKNKKNQAKHWAKALKKLILDENYRKELGNKLYEDIYEEYNLINVTKKRVELYTSLINKKEDELVS
jgi:glycosyltransferase involved in cell wall biosynthesis